MFKIFRKIENRLLRLLVIILLIVLVIAGVAIAFISPIAKRYIESHSEQLIGRKIVMRSLVLNPFTGCLTARGVTMFEKQSTDTFALLGSLSVRMTVRKLFTKNYEVSSITLDQLRVHVIQNDSVFNFSDLIKTDTTKKKDTLSPVHYCIHNIKITNSEFFYDEVSIPVHYYIKKINVESDFIDWDIDSTLVKISFLSGMGSGEVNSTVVYKFKEQGYNMHTIVKRFDLKVLEQYMKDFANYGTIAAFLDADVNASGGFENPLDLQASGKVAVSDFHFGKTPEEDYISFSKFSLNIDSLSPANKKYFFSAVVLDSPFIKYEQYDSLNNFSAIVGEDAKNVKQAKAEHNNSNIIFLFADYIKTLAKNIINSQYRLDEFKINGAYISYTDYSLVERFHLTANPILITAKNIDTRNKRMQASLEAKLNPYGNVTAYLDINPNDFGDFNLKFDVQKMPLPVLNPYIITFTSHPFHKGTIELHGKWNVVNKQINSDNHLLLINPTLAPKMKTRDTKNVPTPLIMAFVRDIHRRVDISLPITGDLNDPHYHLVDVILDILTNIFVKPPTYPYRVAKESEKQEKEDYEMLEWKPMQVKLENDQTSQLKKISRYLFFHRNTSVKVVPQSYEQREKEAILLFEAKKRFYYRNNRKQIDSMSEQDSLEILKMSLKDQAFVTYLNKATDAAKNDFATELKCKKLVGEKKVDELYAKLLSDRKKQIQNFFEDKNISNRVTYESSKSAIPPSGFSNVKFYYAGEKPPPE